MVPIANGMDRHLASRLTGSCGVDIESYNADAEHVRTVPAGMNREGKATMQPQNSEPLHQHRRPRFSILFLETGRRNNRSRANLCVLPCGGENRPYFVSLERFSQNAIPSKVQNLGKQMLICRPGGDDEHWRVHECSDITKQVSPVAIRKM
jgi:hypothetical protein